MFNIDLYSGPRSAVSNVSGNRCESDCRSRGREFDPVIYLPSAELFKKDCCQLLLDFSLTVKAATLIFTSGRASAISPAKEGKSGSIYNLIKNK